VHCAQSGSFAAKQRLQRQPAVAGEKPRGARGAAAAAAAAAAPRSGAGGA